VQGGSDSLRCSRVLTWPIFALTCGLLVPCAFPVAREVRSWVHPQRSRRSWLARFITDSLFFVPIIALVLCIAGVGYVSRVIVRTLPLVRRVHCLRSGPAM
jgi:hypothetical protein